MTLGEFSILTLVAAAVGAVIYYGRARYANGVYDAMLEQDEPGHPGAKRARRIMKGARRGRCAPERASRQDQ